MERTAGGARRTGRAAAEGAELDRAAVAAEVRAELVGAPLGLGATLGALDGDRRAASSHRWSTPSAAEGRGGGGGGGG
jgi:hypothetical protein